MVSLPELDSEIGVLRFLKWKTRLLALDVIRASGRAYINSIDDVQEPASTDPEISSSLEQQDDAAVVKLALSKLNPRHREVLIASMYEEKSTEQIAAQVGLSENATRQLIFRARAAFKKALIGDVDTTGMSAAAILSVAARKAASEGRKVGAAALTLIALVVMSLTVFPGLNRATTDLMAEAPASSGSSDSSNQGSVETELEIAPTPDNGIVEDAAAEPVSPVTSSPSPAATPQKKTVDPVKAVLDAPLSSGLVNSDSRSQFLVLDQNYGAFGDNGLSASFTFNPTSEDAFSNVKVRVNLENYNFDFQPTNLIQISGKNPNGSDVYLLVGDATYLFDEFGRSWSKTELSKSRIKIEVVMEPNGIAVKSIDLVMLAR
jgi:RNA polymerase sigma-70 factor (ECF subfamily)